MPLIKKQNLNDIRTGIRIDTHLTDIYKEIAYVGVSDVDPTCQPPKSNGVLIKESPGSMIVYNRQTYVCDSDNNWIKIGELN